MKLSLSPLKTSYSEKANTSCAFLPYKQRLKREDEQLRIPNRYQLIRAICVSTASWTAACLYDPFIFATPGYYHGDNLPMHPGRSYGKFTCQTKHQPRPLTQ
ncbi:hypothetical protein OK016_24245 [Vibrio chagasii]|nr:hypothetical protein [Vibrio chagasii]